MASGLAMSSMEAQPRGLHRKITVNERIDRILLGTLQEQDARVNGAPEDRDRARERSYQLSSLYAASAEAKFLKARAKASQKRLKQKAASDRARRSIPPLDIADNHCDGVPLASPIKSMSSSSLKTQSSKRLQPQSSKHLQRVEQEDDVFDDESVDGDATPTATTRKSPLSSPSPLRPWYGTSSSPGNPHGVTMDAKVRRYGAFGVVKMMASETPTAVSPPYKLSVSQSLDSLGPRNLPNAWSSPIKGTPTLWPEGATYPNGSKLQTRTVRCPSPVARIPTNAVGDIPADDHLERAKVAHRRDVKELEQRFDDEKLRRKQEIEANRAELTSWQQSLDFEPLSSKMDHPIMRIKGKRAMHQMTILHTPEYSHDSQFNEQVQKMTENKFALRWSNMAVVLEVMRRTPCRRPVLQDVEKLFSIAYELAFKNITPTALTRQQFWLLLQKEYPDVEAGHANRLFSSYDFRMQDKLDIRAFLGTIRALKVQQGSPIDMLCMSFRDFDATKTGVISSLEDFVNATTICCGDDADERCVTTRATCVWNDMKAEVKSRVQWHRRPQLDDSLASVRSDYEDLKADELETELRLMAEGRVSIRHARTTLQREKKLLQLYTNLLLKRREECFNVVIPAAR